MVSLSFVISFSDALKNSTTNQRPAREQLIWPIWDREHSYYECAHGISWPGECEDCTHCPQCDYSFGDGYVLLACPECDWYRQGWRDKSYWANAVKTEFGTDPNEVDLWEKDILFYSEEEEDDDPWFPEE